MTRSYALRLLLPVSLVDFATLAVLVLVAGPQGEANPFMSAALGAGGLAGAAALKAFAVLAAVGFEALARASEQPAWGPRFIRLASIGVAVGVALNVASLALMAADGAFG